MTTKLSEFSIEQNTITKTILDRVLVQHHRKIELSADEFEVVLALIAEGPPKISRLLMMALAPSSLSPMGEPLLAAKGAEWLASCPSDRAGVLFLGMKAPTQRSVLETVYSKNPELYGYLKGKTAGHLVRVGSAVVSKARGDALVETRADRLLDQVMDDSVSGPAMDVALDALVRDFDWEDVIRIVGSVSGLFNDQKVPLNAASDFKKHLKWHQIMARLPKALPDETVAAWDHHVVVALGRMPDVTWVFKVLDQFPVVSISRILRRINRNVEHKDLSVRNQSSRLLKEIRDNIDTLNFENVRLAVYYTPS